MLVYFYVLLLCVFDVVLSFELRYQQLRYLFSVLLLSIFSNITFFLVICYLQGNLIGRAVVEFCDGGPPVRVLIIHFIYLFTFFLMPCIHFCSKMKGEVMLQISTYCTYRT